MDLLIILLIIHKKNKHLHLCKCLIFKVENKGVLPSFLIFALICRISVVDTWNGVLGKIFIALILLR